MARIPEHIIDTIIQTARIEEVIGEFVHLKRAGSNLKGLSPFTDEKTPSFMVSPAKQIFKCFSTGKGGSVVTFIMEKEHYSYPEALRWLADKYNIELPKEEEQSPEQVAAQTERESLQIINEFAKTHFMESMHQTEEGKVVGLSYFVERGFRKDIIEKFQLGYCLNSGHSFTDAAKAKGYKLEFCEKVGLVKSKDDRHFDFFRGRVIFPIHSITGRVLGFGGRTLTNDKKVAKYFNSPESIIYNKSEILYGLYFAKGDIIKYDNCYLVEGYTDVISMHQAGITNVVSSSGTSLTREQIKLMRRYTSNITILYDGDAAGIKASFRGIDLILEEGLNVHVVLFPDGDDPDSYSKKVSTEELETYIKDHRKDFISFKAELLLGEGSQDPSVRVKLIHEIVESIALIPDQISRSIFSKEIAARFDIDPDIISQELFRIRKKQLAKTTNEPAFEQRMEEPAPKYQSVESTKAPAKTHEEHDLIRILIKYGAYATEVDHEDEFGKTSRVTTSVSELIVHELQRDELYFKSPLFCKVYDIILSGLQENQLYKSSFFLKHEDPEIVHFVSEIETEKYEISSNWLRLHNIETKTELEMLNRAVMDAVYAFKIRFIKNRIEELTTLISQVDVENSFQDLELLLGEKVALEKVKINLSKQLGRTITD
ncbi:MAG: primase [Crocinitomicaceae bacterium]|jgi:DNA primase|nr:primase [Crocinitomicaceae bacterium]